MSLGLTAPPNGFSQYISVQNPASGGYSIQIRDIDAILTSYSLMETAFAPDGSELWTYDISGTVAPGSVDQYSLVYPGAGDANGDGKVDVNDLTIVLSNFGQTGMTWSQGDFNGDGSVDINDLTILLSNFGTTSGAGIQAVPEPSTFAPLVRLGRVPVGLRLAAAKWQLVKHPGKSTVRNQRAIQCGWLFSLERWGRNPRDDDGS